MAWWGEHPDDWGPNAVPPAPTDPELKPAPQTHPAFDFADADFTIRVRVTEGNQTVEFKVHKAILAKASSMFEGMQEVCDTSGHDGSEAVDPCLDMECKWASTWPAILGACYNQHSLCNFDITTEKNETFTKLQECWETSYRYQFTAAQLICDLYMRDAIRGLVASAWGDLAQEDYHVRKFVVGTFLRAQTVSSSFVEDIAWEWMRKDNGSWEGRRAMLLQLPMKEQNLLLQHWMEYTSRYSWAGNAPTMAVASTSTARAVIWRFSTCLVMLGLSIGLALGPSHQH